MDALLVYGVAGFHLAVNVVWDNFCWLSIAGSSTLWDLPAPPPPRLHDGASLEVPADAPPRLRGTSLRRRQDAGFSARREAPVGSSAVVYAALPERAA
jgi:hypothetical protein